VEELLIRLRSALRTRRDVSGVRSQRRVGRAGLGQPYWGNGYARVRRGSFLGRGSGTHNQCERPERRKSCCPSAAANGRPVRSRCDQLHLLQCDGWQAASLRNSTPNSVASKNLRPQLTASAANSGVIGWASRSRISGPKRDSPILLRTGRRALSVFGQHDALHQETPVRDAKSVQEEISYRFETEFRTLGDFLLRPLARKTGPQGQGECRLRATGANLCPAEPGQAPPYTARRSGRARYPRAHEATAERDAPLPAGAGSWVYQNFPPSESSYRDPSGRVTRTAASGKAASSRPARSGGVT
jgi:hypothetical protein